MKLGQAAAVALALVAASPGEAKETKRADEILARMPSELDGSPVLKLPDGLLMYFLRGPSGEEMVIGVMVTENAERISPEEIGSRLRKVRSDKFNIRQILREGTFTAPKWPGAATRFVDFVGEKFLQQKWDLITDMDAINVIATYANKNDARRAEALVAKNIFGGAVVSATKPAE